MACYSAETHRLAYIIVLLEFHKVDGILESHFYCMPHSSSKAIAPSFLLPRTRGLICVSVIRSGPC